MWVSSGCVDHQIGLILPGKDVLSLVIQDLELAIKFLDIVSIGFRLSSSTFDSQVINHLLGVFKNEGGRQMRVLYGRG